MLAAMSRASHIASDSNADLLPSYRRDIDLIHAIRSELLDDLEAAESDRDRYRAALEVIAGSSQDKLQAMQAKAALTNIGAPLPQP
jgi:hypothetical protein